MTMTIKRSHIIVLLAACLFAAGSTFFLLSDGTANASLLSYQCFKTNEGWGYNILAGKKIIVHQPFIPGVSGHAGFKQEQQAANVARIVIEKIKSGQLPVINHQQLQHLDVLHTQVK
jgi:hypothetical protein